MLRAAVPETAVDEDGEADLGECEVRPSRQIQPPSPARHPSLSEEPSQNCLRGFVAAASNQPHDSGPFRAVNAVDHRPLQTRFFARLLDGRATELREALSG